MILSLLKMSAWGRKINWDLTGALLTGETLEMAVIEEEDIVEGIEGFPHGWRDTDFRERRNECKDLFVQRCQSQRHNGERTLWLFCLRQKFFTKMFKVSERFPFIMSSLAAMLSCTRTKSKLHPNHKNTNDLPMTLCWRMRPMTLRTMPSMCCKIYKTWDDVASSRVTSGRFVVSVTYSRLFLHHSHESVECVEDSHRSDGAFVAILRVALNHLRKRLRLQPIT